MGSLFNCCLYLHFIDSFIPLSIPFYDYNQWNRFSISHRNSTCNSPNSTELRVIGIITNFKHR